MMRLKVIILISFTVINVNLFGQITLNKEAERNISNIVTADMDRDQLQDSLYYNFRDSALVFLLSSNAYQPVLIDWPIEEDNTLIWAKEGGVSVSTIYARASNSDTYIYEDSSRQFRLAEMNIEAYGYNSSSIYTVNLLDNKFIADWSYWDDELGLQIELPTVVVKMNIKPIYITESFYPDVPTGEIYSLYRDKIVIDMRLADISRKSLLKSFPEPVPIAVLSRNTLDDLMKAKGLDMYYDNNSDNRKFVVIDSSRNGAYFYRCKALAMPGYAGHHIFLLQFEIYDNSTVVLYLFKENGECNEFKYFRYNNEKEDFYITMEQDYSILVRTVNKMDNVLVEEQKVTIDVVNCKITQKSASKD